MKAHSRLAALTRSLSLGRVDLWIPAGLFALGLAVRLAIIRLAHFDGLYGQDAFAYLEYARQIFVTPAGSPLPGPFYWPLGYPALGALFMFLAGSGPLGPQLVSLLTGAAVGPCLYWIVRSLGPAGSTSWAAAAAAGLIALACGQLLQSSIVVMADAPGIFWATLSALALLRWQSRAGAPAGRWLLLAAGSLAAATVTRWIYGGLVLPFGSFAALTYIGQGNTARLKNELGWAAAAGLIFAAIVAPQVLFSQSSAAPVLSHSWVLDWNPLNAFRLSFDNPDGHFDYALPPAIFYAEPLFHPYYLLPLFTPAVLVGAWRLRRSPALVLLGGWILTLYLYLIGLPYENFRFGLAWYAPVAVLAAVGLAGLRPRQLAASVLVGAAATTPFVYRGLTPLFGLKAREIAAARFLEGALPARATVITFGLTLTLDYYTDLNTVELSEQTPETLQTILCGAGAVYTFVQVDNLETQWAGLPPLLNFKWLRERAGLIEIGRLDDWVLFKPATACPASP